VATGRRNERAATAGLKMLAYGDSIVALVAAQRAGADEALFLDTEGHCSEATSSNLFAWTGDRLITPPVSCAVLPGITRATVIEIAESLGLAVEERPFGVDLLVGAHEAFLTSSLRGIAPLVRVDESVIGDGRPGAITRRIASAYSALIQYECSAALPTSA
jgi:branched-chain amino acid aminotransferase